jgi:hypothetical protein
MLQSLRLLKRSQVGFAVIFMITHPLTMPAIALPSQKNSLKHNHAKDLFFSYYSHKHA